MIRYLKYSRLNKEINICVCILIALLLRAVPRNAVVSIVRGRDYFVIDIAVFKCRPPAKFGGLTQRDRERTRSLRAPRSRWLNIQFYIIASSRRMRKFTKSTFIIRNSTICTIV